MILIVAFVCVIALMYVQRVIYEKYWADHLDVKISYKNANCVAGEENELVEVIVNDKWLPLPMLHVKFDTPKSFVFENEKNSSISDYYYRDDVFTIMGHQSVTRTLKFKCMGRGCFYMHDTNITSSDLFLSATLTDRRKNEKIIHVFPRKVNIEFLNIPFNTITGNFATNKNLIEDPFEFRGIRQYQPFDSIKHINWKSSAKNNDLKVNTFFMTSSQNVKVVLNMDTHVYTRDDRLIEDTISLASSICEGLINAGIPVGLITNGRDIYTGDRIIRDSGSGVKHMVAIDTALARIDSHAVNFSFADTLEEYLLPKDNEFSEYTYFMIISNNRSREVIDVYKKSKDIGVVSYFIIPEFKQYPVTESIPDMIQWNLD